MRHSWVYLLICGFGFGIVVESLGNFGLYSGVLYLTAAVLFLIFGIVADHKKSLAISLIFFACALGVARTNLFEYTLPLSVVSPLFNQSVSLDGIVVADPDEREGNTKLTIETTGTNPFRVLVTVDRYPQYAYGDRVHIEGKLIQPQSFSDDGVHVFNYPKWLAKDGVVALMRYPEISPIESGKGSIVLRTLYALKDSFLGKIHRLIPEPESGLLAGLLVGSKQALGSDLQDMFRRAGVVHVVVLSGYNITIVATAFMHMVAFLPKALGATFGALGMILFVLMVGASATAVRATIMALLVLFAQMTGRSTDSIRILLIAAFFMLLQNPYILAFDPSFQLSFLATLGLIVYSPYFEQKLLFIPEKFGIRSVAVATLSTQVMVLPLLLWMNGLFSIVALPVNLLILGFIPFAMLTGFVAGILGFISWWIAIPFAFVTELILRYQLFIIHLFASLPFAAISIPVFPFWAVVIWYGLYAFAFWKKKIKSAGAYAPAD